MLVFRRILVKNNYSLHLIKKDLMIWKHHVESTLYLEVRKDTSRVRGCICGNTKIGLVLDVKVCFRQGRYGVEIIDRIFFSRPNSFLGSHRERNQQMRNRNVRTKFLLQALRTEVQRKPVAKATPRPKPTFTLTLVSMLYRQRKWIDVDPGKFSQSCFEVWKFMIRLLRHDESVRREDDGAVRFDDLEEKFKAKFDGTSQWTIEAWIAFLPNGGGPKKRLQYCLNP